MTKEEKEEKAKKIATEIVCKSCRAVLRVRPHRCRLDPCGTWYEGYMCALEALEEYERS